VRERMVDAGRVPLRLREWGGQDSPALLFWPGLNPSAHAQLNEAGPVWAAEFGFRVICVSPPGWETDALPPERYRTTALADLAVAAMDALELERAAFAGFSWGASIGCHVAARAPQRLNALVLLDAGYTNFQDQPGFEPTTLEAMIDEVRRLSLEFHSWAEVYAHFKQRARTWRSALEERVHAGMVERGGLIAPRVAPETAGAAWHGVVAEPPRDAIPALAQNDVPILLLTASETVGEDWAAQALRRFRAAVPRAEVVEVDSGHDLLADAPEETIRIVGDWLRSLVAGPH
jgi:pimeloyl-ACP methyl ester carboxylesterase